ncbi:exported protein of unknown function [Pseudodesulfovibrio profundus]|uniref:Uncharacterized protein n=1 Tax=Pseudodesulfovibrio profundus TaxID=57320 RepID=A0A2C8FDS2_9BACT|nr:hypothetical protein [Pseudodesulfovibrio profundus]SOB60314.1 exported protein of unknown function [Pseudodesulfovibrio profundus]
MKKFIYAMLWICMLSTPLQADGSAHNTKDNTETVLTASVSMPHSAHAFNPAKGETR